MERVIGAYSVKLAKIKLKLGEIISIYKRGGRYN